MIMVVVVVLDAFRLCLSRKGATAVTRVKTLDLMLKLECG